MTEKTTLEKYIDYVKSCIDEKGIHPAPAWMLSPDDKLTVMAMVVPPEQIYTIVLGYGKKENPKEVMFGIDRYNKKGQGIDIRYKSVFTIMYMNTAKEEILILALPYNSPTDIGELQHDNKWWQFAVSREFTQSYIKFYGPPKTPADGHTGS